MKDAGIVKVEASGSEELTADEAVLHIVVSGKKFRFQNAAAVKADEIRPLVEGLKQLGVADDDIRITSVETSTESGRLTKSSSATYRMNIAVKDLDNLPDALGLITSVDDCRLQRTEWRFGTENEHKEKLLKKVAADATRRASTMAQVAGSSIAGIKYISDSYSAPVAPVARGISGGAPEVAGSTRTRSAAVDIGTTFVETKMVRVVVAAEFWLNEGFESSL